MWPMFVDYSDDDCRRVLRSLEHEAYSSIINAFRAQGSLTKDRKKMLQELCSTLGISMERHRSEIRRAVNDEHLSTIAERLSGPNTVTEWSVEGKRVVPLMQRLAPQTIFTEMANSAASAQAVKNASLPLPGKTGTREISNGMETMSCRKRKDLCSDSSCVSPHKMSAMDSQYFHNLLPLDNTGMPEPSNVPDASLSSESSSLPEIVPQGSSSFSDLSIQRNMAPLMANTMSVCPQKPSLKHSAPKSSSTVTTFSSFDQMTSNLLSSRAAATAPVPAPDDQVSDGSKPLVDLKSNQRPLSSIGSMKSSTIVIPTPTSSAGSTSKDRIPTPSSSSTSQSNKFLTTQIRSKTPSHTRQNLPAGLGIKLGSQPSLSQRATITPKSPMKMKSDSVTFFNKKAPPSSPNVFPSDCHGSSFCGTSQCEPVANLNKSPHSVAKSNPKTESLVNSKPTAVGKPLPKAAPTSNSQLTSRSLFSTTTLSKSGAKNMSPVIFNVASTTSSTLHTSTKPTGSAVSETGKMTAQLLPKSSTVGLNSSHLKITSSNSQTIQYRNDGGLVRSARIVNISQSGTHLPCAISPSAISALGLSSSSGGALRVTLPAGSLSSNSAIRVSSAAKPNVIVVHKAQMWPRAQPGAAVIMSSTPITKLTNDVEPHPSPKQDKGKPVGIKPLGTKVAPRAIAPARPLSPAVLVAKASDSSASTNSTHRADSSLSETQSSKAAAENMAQCKKNLLADIMEASGILLDNTLQNKSSNREKSNMVKRVKDLSNHQEVEIISEKNSVSSSGSEAISRLSDSHKSKEQGSSNFSGDAALTVSPVERNGVDPPKPTPAQAQSTETLPKEACNTIVSSSHTPSESVTSSSECGTTVHKEIAKDKDS